MRAGRTIRQEDARWAPAGASAAGFAVGLATGLGALSAVRSAGSVLRPAGGIGAGLFAALVCRRTASRAMARASGAILAGNKTVIDDLGRRSSQFVCAFLREADRTPEGLAAFLAELSPAPSAEGGQSLLRDAYREYFPPLLRRVVTARALTFQVGGREHSVGRDVVPPSGSPDFPVTLATIESPELRAFLAQWDRTPDTQVGSAARDRSDIGDRINYIVDLFRTHQHDPALLRPPFGPAEQGRILGLSASIGERLSGSESAVEE